ncbi:PTS transporter subunit EIIC [Propioniciclava coleopterorum]|uniref:PTS transporter subunit EIIC n=1 Tax=Propioniciclava coleopterorum TaxID=2714937 RepID=A0A6G7Y3S1_9ACTN|nr:PTS transporter subunit IIABC [Propioniciclava coleopterorum]QIK71534.1 PTS transporter subunit EIIC [Propioniciclava coleopterorum]
MTTKTEAPAKSGGLRVPGFAQLQRLGKSLMLPIALLPAAGILLRLGQDDLLGRIDAPVIGPFFDAMSAAGNAIFANLPLLFAVGVAIGFAKKADGSTALSAVAGYLVIDGVFKSMSPVVLKDVVDKAGEQAMINYGVFAGIIVGLLTAWLFDKYHDIQLPTYLGFFGGRRFVPIVVSLATLITGFALSYFYPIFNAGLTGLGQFIAASGVFGAFTYGFVNRMLIPLGLHHIVNSYIWFIYGDYVTPTGVVTGELTRFAAGDPAAGALTAGFYPILMFGLPAAALAMIHVARPAQKKLAAGILTAAGLTAFLTGITEPLEFAFMFVAFPLYVVHALLTGLSMAIAYALDIHLGFSFSAGLIDLLLYGTAPAAKNIPLLIGLGLAFAVFYYFLFRFVIIKWNMMTPGRAELADIEDAEVAAAGALGDNAKAEQLIAAFGGRENLKHVDACITRLRIEVGDKAKVNQNRLKALGAAGVIEVGNNVQAVFGPQADALKSSIQSALAANPTAPPAELAAAIDAPVVAAPVEEEPVATGVPVEPITLERPVDGQIITLEEVPDPVFSGRTMGDGFAVVPTDGTFRAPVSGKLVLLAKTMHAYAIKADNGAEILVHIGIDTVKLKGEGFTALQAQGERVEAGDPIIRVDLAAVAPKVPSMATPVLVTNGKKFAVSAVDLGATGHEPVVTVSPK